MPRQQIHEIRKGKIKLRIFSRKISDHAKEVYSVEILRLFKNGDQWKQSKRFGVNDLPLVRLLLDQVHGWILLRKSASDEGDE